MLPGYLREIGWTYHGTVVLLQTVREQLGVTFSVAVLCGIWEDSKECLDGNESFAIDKCVVLLDCLEDEPPVPTGYSWVPLQEASVDHLFTEAAAAIRSEINFALSEKVPAKRAPWARPGWFEKAVAWMDASLR